MTKNMKHGGDLDAIQRKYHIKKEELINFSGNINPLGFPERVKQALAENLDLVAYYPDREYVKLRKSIAAYTGAQPEHILVDNGSTELISLFIRYACTGRAVIMGPAYSEYEREIKLTGQPYDYFELREKEDFQLKVGRLLKTLTPEVRLLVMCNPNNPTGTAVTSEQMKKILAHCRKNGTFVMVDETYIEFSDEVEQICSIPLTAQYPNLFVIRGVAKFFAAPGLRLGYGVCGNNELLMEIKKRQRPWSVNILASFAGERMFADKRFISRSAKLVSEERRRAYAEISTWKRCKIYPSQANFLLIRLPEGGITAREVFEALIRENMLIRDAASFTFLDEHYLRFCLLAPKQNRLLLKRLKQLIG